MASAAATNVVLMPIADLADHFLIGDPATATSAVPFDVTVTVLDTGNNIDTVCTGTVTFTRSDTAPSVVLPADVARLSADLP